MAIAQSYTYPIVVQMLTVSYKQEACDLLSDVSKDH